MNLLARLVDNLRITTKISLVVGLMAAVALGVGSFAIVRMADLNRHADASYELGAVPLDEIGQLKTDLERTRRDSLDFAISHDAAAQAAYSAALRDDDAAVERDVATYAKITRNAALVAQLRARWAEYRRLRDEQFLPACRRDDHAAVEQIRTEVLAPVANQAVEIADRLAAEERSAASRRRDDADAVYRRDRLMISVILLAGVAGALAVGLFVAHTVVRAVRRVSAAIRALAGCDLTRPATLTTRDEFGVMAGDLDRAIRSVRDTVGELAGTAVTLGSAAQQLSTMSDALNAGAEEASGRAASAAGKADEINHSISSVLTGAEEMAASIREIATTSTQAALVSAESMHLVSETTTRIGELGQASSEIGDVIRLITSIAEQTNLLALNATIEAARAGAAGKGFAVVASEVKELAQETARATEDITSRIGAVQVSSGGAARAVEQIQEVIEQVSEFNTTVASAVEQQSATTNEMTRSIMEAARGSSEVAASFNAVAEVTTATSDTARASRQAAGQLADLAVAVNKLVERFRY
jgi:methyl-accepting chemotaxis protein